MAWTQEQIEAMRAVGIDPAHVPCDAGRASDDGATNAVTINSDLSDAEFAVVAPVLPAEPRQEGALSNRSVLDALLWCQRTDKRLTQLPSRYGTAEAVRKRAERWAVSGAWDRVLGAVDGFELGSSRRESIRRIAGAQVRRGERIRNSQVSALP